MEISRSTWSLIGANVFTLVLALIFNWSVLSLMWIYWAQSVAIGVEYFIRIVSAKSPAVGNTDAAKKFSAMFRGVSIFMALFFALHYGGFHLGYLIFLLAFSFMPTNLGAPPTLDVFLLIAILGFIASQIYSYKQRSSSPEQIMSTGKLMGFPYLRIIPMHLTIIFGLFLTGKLALILFIILKSFADAGMQTYFEKHFFNSGYNH